MASTVRDLADKTPATRDRYMDLLRVASLGTVVLGHWLMAAVSTDDAGQIQLGNLLAELPALQLLTWALQVMPVFFFVGGFSHALSYRSLQRKAGDSTPVYAAFLRARLQRLLRPTMVFILVWGAAALVLQLIGGSPHLADITLRLVPQPLWFIGIYLAMVAFTPPLLRLHERYGWGAFGGLVAAAAAVDLLRFAAGVPYLEFLNFAFVWLAVHQLGFLRADGRLHRPALLAAAGVAGASLLVAFGPYPLSMVGMPGEKISNMAPPTFALLCHGLWLVGAVELVRKAAARWLERPKVWRTVVAANGISMTAFLWHLTAMLGVYGVFLGLDVALPAPASAAWWAQVPVRIALAAVLTALLVAAFRGFERPAAARPAVEPRGAGGSGPLAALGITLCLFGVLGLSMVGYGDLLEGRSAMLIAFRITAPAAVAMALVGWFLVERAGRARA
ncbi:acyltransferase family protein [Streptomyces indicus]|uniref:Acyltransferase family protein n=1 Tax=Streptomyces indicus TaxID=417292 RepID=A0A1G9GXU3_9ACTN|nr:acyltransferase [Streptomyces indicus]SDL05405.1 Acyltransferase family protein [Streptomyces indicus]